VKKELIVTAKTVEEARRQAAAQLEVAEEDLLVTVLEEGKKGFLGIGATEAKISVSYVVKGEDAAMDFIRKLISNMGLEGLVIGKKEGNNDDVVITVDGENAGLLIGHHGETLDSLQYLANLAANKKVNGEKREYVKITLDIENYRAKREATLRTLARRMASKVVKYKKSVMLEPMNPYERRIIHSEVQGIVGVSTNSIGSENNRRVVMFLDDSKPESTQENED
jgi:spoIIIJ-associated protein